MNYFNYFSDIEEAFVRRRGRHLLLNTRDWALMEEWERRGVPLHVVLRAVNDVFDLYDKRKGVKREIMALSYCKSEVEAGFLEWTDSQVGGGQSAVGGGQLADGGLSVEGVEAHIDEVLDALGRIYRKDIEDDLVRAVKRLTVLRQSVTSDFEAVDAALQEIEKDLDAAMLTSWKRSEFEPIEAEIAGQMEEYRATMTDDAFENTSTLLLLDRLRKVSGIPRLSLFSM